MDTEPYCGVMDGPLICIKKRRGGFCFHHPCEVRETEREWEMKGRYGRARMEVADCGGVEPAVSLASPSATWVSRTAASRTQQHTNILTCTLLSPATVSYWHYQAAKCTRRKDAAHTVSQLDRRPGSSTRRLAGRAAGTQLLSH